MKLHTSIAPRRDGTVLVTGLDAQKYTFVRDADGELSGDVPHLPTVAMLLAGGLFYPADEGDFDEALKLSTDGGDADADEGDFEDDGPGVPVELNTPPAPTRRKPGPKPKAASAA